jgi:nicotinate-nucleotide pyrophosphorylase (carboxylating)
MPTLPGDLAATVATALAEDVGSGDPRRRSCRRHTTGVRESSRAKPIGAGGPALRRWCSARSIRRVQTEWYVDDGDAVVPDQLLFRLDGPARSLLPGTHGAQFRAVLSGTATATRRYADAISGLPCRILDTRKTIPGLRNAQKYAVRCGGGTNHRIGLYDGIP